MQHKCIPIRCSKYLKKKKKEILNSLAMAWEQVACQNTLDVFEVKEETSERVHNVQIKSSQ